MDKKETPSYGWNFQSIKSLIPAAQEKQEPTASVTSLASVPRLSLVKSDRWRPPAMKFEEEITNLLSEQPGQVPLEKRVDSHISFLQAKQQEAKALPGHESWASLLEMKINYFAAFLLAHDFENETLCHKEGQKALAESERMCLLLPKAVNSEGRFVVYPHYLEDIRKASSFRNVLGPFMAPPAYQHLFVLGADAQQSSEIYPEDHPLYCLFWNRKLAFLVGARIVAQETFMPPDKVKGMSLADREECVIITSAKWTLHLCINK